MIPKLTFLCTVIIILLLPTLTSAQFEGTWLVTEVKVGDEEMTPVSKWFQFDATNKILSGNGGMMNSRGAWQYDENDQSLLFFGKEDEYGAFQIEMGGGTMSWSREEDGMAVTVYLEQTDGIPTAPWDNIIGSWTKIEQSGESLILGPIETILIRWDRVFAITELDNNEKHFGVWHIHGHKPELKLLSGKGDAFDSTWVIEFDGEGNMTWRSKDESIGLELIFSKN